METMNIALPSNMKDFVQRRVDEGGYSSVSEYVRELIRLDQRETAKAFLEAEVLKGMATGSPTPMTPADWKELRDKIRNGSGSRKKK